MVTGEESRQRTVTLATAAMLAVLIVGWGGNYALVKLALRDMAPFTFNALRFGGAAMVIAALTLAMKGQLLPLRSERPRLAVVGICQVTVMLGLSSLGLLWIEASRAVLIAYTMPLFAIVLGRLILGESFGPAKVIGAAVGFGGLALLFNPLAMDWTQGELLMGSLIALGGTLGWATGSTLYRTRTWESPFWSQVFWQVAVGAVPLALLAAIFEADAPVNVTPTLIGLVIYNWLVPAALAYWCWARVLSRMPASTAGQILMLAPVYGVFLAQVIFDEPLSPILLASGALILIGAWLTLRAREGAVRAH